MIAFTPRVTTAALHGPPRFPSFRTFRTTQGKVITKKMAAVFALGARPVGELRVIAQSNVSRPRITRVTCRPVPAARGRVAGAAMPGMPVSRGVSVKLSAFEHKRVELSSTYSLATTEATTPSSPETKAAVPASSRIAVPAFAFSAAVLAMSPAGPASAAATAVATINQADTAWVLISTGTPHSSRQRRRHTRFTERARSPFPDGPKGAHFPGVSAAVFADRGDFNRV
jgi:hypothetical protein